VLVLEVGVGRERVEQAMRWLFAAPKLGEVPAKPKLVLSAGFSGSLQDGLRVGDIVLATEVAQEDGTVWSTSWPSELPPDDWRPPLHRGRVLMMDRLIGDPAEKRRLGLQHQSIAVDMESAVIAQWCQRHSTPFGCLRAISDDVETSLSPKLLGLLSNGRTSWPRLAWSALRSPSLLQEMIRLARHTHLAAERLGKTLSEIMTWSLQ
jgi:nucleoside phosphorylase